jgi:hypothetical protein
MKETSSEVKRSSSERYTGTAVRRNCSEADTGSSVKRRFVYETQVLQ